MSGDVNILWLMPTVKCCWSWHLSVKFCCAKALLVEAVGEPVTSVTTSSSRKSLRGLSLLVFRMLFCVLELASLDGQSADSDTDYARCNVCSHTK